MKPAAGPRSVEAGAEARRLKLVLLALALLAVLAELVIALHPHFAVEATFAFHAWYALLATVGLAALAAAIARVLGRHDAYREESGDG